MKSVFFASIFLLLFNCSTELVDTWKNPEISSYQPSKLLVIGMTSNMKARHQFENQLKGSLNRKGFEVTTSLEFFDPSVLNEKIIETEMIALENKLLSEDYDTVLITKVIGVEDKIRYKRNYKDFDQTYKKFGEDYLMHQDIYYNPEYYEDYTIYHTETSMYCICPGKERELIWKGYIDMTEPQNIEKVIDDYVKLIILALEEEQLLTPLSPKQESEDSI